MATLRQTRRSLRSLDRHLSDQSLPVCYWALIITIKVVTYMSKGSKYCLTSPFRKISYKKCLFVTLCLMVLKMFKSRERLKRLHVIMGVYL